MSQSTGVKSSRQTEVLPESTTTEPTIEQIRQRAYEIYLSRDGAPGDQVQDWLDAERELRSK